MFWKKKPQEKVYFKYPCQLYKAKDYNKFLQSSTGETQDDESEIDRIYRAAGMQDGDSVHISGVTVWSRMPLEDLEGCYYEPTSSAENYEEEHETGILTSTMVYLANGNSFSTKWTVEEFESKLIELGIVDKVV